MSLEQLSYRAQIVASVGVIASLIFVGLQIKHNTGALQRNDHNSTMAQWTVTSTLNSFSEVRRGANVQRSTPNLQPSTKVSLRAFHQLSTPSPRTGEKLAPNAQR